jgi:outer membrane protein assembly factor BamD
MQAPAAGTGVGVEVVNAPSGPAQAPASNAATDPNAVIKPVGPTNTVVPPVEKPAEAPLQVNDIKPGENPAQPTTQTKANGKTKKPKVDQSEESSSKKKKKKGLGKLNPF